MRKKLSRQSLLKIFQTVRIKNHQRSFPKEIRIKTVNTPDEIQSLFVEISKLLPLLEGHYNEGAIEKEDKTILNLFAEVCVGLWRSRNKLIDPGTNLPSNESPRALRSIETTLDHLKMNGFEIKDRINEPYVVGMIEKVIAWENTVGIDNEKIIETIKPTIIYKDQVLRVGEIIVGVPVKE